MKRRGEDLRDDPPAPGSLLAILYDCFGTVEAHRFDLHTVTCRWPRPEKDADHHSIVEVDCRRRLWAVRTPQRAPILHRSNHDLTWLVDQAGAALRHGDK